MHIAIVYNKPVPSYYDTAGEQKAVNGVLSAVAAVQWSLLELSHTVVCVPLEMPIETVKRKLGKLKADLVFNLFEGFCGYPGTEPDIPVILSEMGIPYTGCPPDALKLALNKADNKVVLKAGGLDTPDFQLLGPGNLSSFHLRYPCIVKPGNEDGSHGMSEDSVVNDFPALERQLTRVIHLYGGDVTLVEEYINGREFNATVIGNSSGKALAVSEIAFSLSQGMPEILTYASKWDTDSDYYRGTKAVCPAQISEDERQHIAGVAEKAFALTGCRGYARVDMRMDSQGRLNVIEVNPNPDISADSGAALQAKTAGMDYKDFIGKIISLAQEAK
ncbi:ATP-grasp domain-containing protein [Chloroflexota bacterium]